MPNPRRLYTTNEVAETLGVARSWVHTHLRERYVHDAPQPDFVASLRGKHLGNLWTEQSLIRWQAYRASRESSPTVRRYTGYSDHNAVNRVGPLAITWKLWWRTAPHGSTMWWFSTPSGWWTSDDNGVTWTDSGLSVRPSDYHYYCVNGSVKPSATVATILQSLVALRHRLEAA